MNHSIPSETIDAIKTALQLRRADPECETATTDYLARKHGISRSKVNRLWLQLLRTTPIDAETEKNILTYFDKYHSIRRAATLAGVPKRVAQRVVERERETPKPMKARGDTLDVKRFDWAVPTLRMFQDGMIQCGLQYMQDHNISVAQLAAQQMKRLGML